MPDRAQLRAWRAGNAGGNLALRHSGTSIAVDVDNYHDKNGAATLKRFERDAGCAFPPTCYSTARDDGSRQRFYRVPPGLAWPSKLGPGVEVIHSGHRYSVVWPSVHPDTGAPYQWFDALGRPMDRPPRPEECAELPAALVQALTAGVALREATGSASAEQGAALLDELPQGAMTPAVRALLSTALEQLDANRHDNACKNVFDLVRYGDQGETGVPIALAALRGAYPPAVADRDAPQVAEAEFDRMVATAARKVAADRTPAAEREGIVLARAALGANGGRIKTVRLGSVDKPVQRPRYAPVPPAELAQSVPPMRWLVRDVWPEHSFGPVGGEKKTLKTYNLLAMTVAVASGKPLFGQFAVEAAGPVLYYVGEGGARPFRRRLQAVARAYGFGLDALAELPIHAVFDVGALNDEDFVEQLTANLDELRPALVIVDPLYAFHPAGVEAQNLYERGRMLAKLSSLTADRAALMVADHFRKSTGSDLDLDYIAQAGMGQWADSWILQRHAKGSPDLEAGSYLLEVEFGSRQWGGGRWSVEWWLPPGGTSDEPGDGITWAVSKATARAAAVEARDAGQRTRLEQILRDHPYEFTKTQLVGALGGNKSKAEHLISSMAGDGAVVVEKRNVPDKNGRMAKRDVYGLRPHRLGLLMPPQGAPTRPGPGAG